MNTYIVTTTFSKREKYCDKLSPVLNAFWPGHPEVHFLTDRGKINHDNVIVLDSESWTRILLEGLKKLRLNYPSVRIIFLMIEDHYPLRSCDVRQLQKVFEAVLNHHLKCVVFPTYPWPWSRTSDIVLPGNKVMCWPKIDTVRFDDCLMARIPPNFFRYNQIQPAFWDIDYLIYLCDDALSRHVHDAWSFEALDVPKKEQHYVSAYQWPSVPNGFLQKGRVRKEAIEYIQVPLANEFRSFLRKEYFFQQIFLFPGKVARKIRMFKA